MVNIGLPMTSSRNIAPRCWCQVREWGDQWKRSSLQHRGNRPFLLGRERRASCTTIISNSTIWNEFQFRDDDIVIGTYAKSGTTWTQQIVAQLIFEGADGLEVAEMSPWLDLRVPPKEVKLPAVEAQTASPVPEDPPAGGRARLLATCQVSLYRPRRPRRGVEHVQPPRQRQRALVRRCSTRRRVGSARRSASRRPMIRQYFLDWLERDGHPFWPFWENIRSWWEIRHLPNVLMLHFAELKADMPGQIRRIAAFLDIEIDESRLPAIVEHCSFDYMKRNATKQRAAGRRLLGRRCRDLRPQGHQRPLARYAHSRGLRPLRADRAGAAWPGLRGVARRGRGTTRDGGRWRAPRRLIASAAILVDLARTAPR